MTATLVIASLALALNAAPAPSVKAEGLQFEIARLDNGERSHMNRTYTWQNVPEPLRGWQCTRVAGGVRGKVEATPAADGLVYIAGCPGTGNMKGWRLVREWVFNYTDANRTKVRVFSKPCKAGQRIEIPQGGWTGMMLIAPKITGGPSTPKPDHSRVPGVVIAHRPKYTQCYIGCPSITILPDGRYVASHSIFGRGVDSGNTFVYRSADRGRTWKPLAKLARQHFSTLFVHRGALYIFGTGGNHGQVVIRRSDDGGETWTEPKGPKSGILLPEGIYHTSTVPVVLHKGRLWRAMEDNRAGRGWPRQFRAFMMSAPEDANLLQASSWLCSNRVASKDTWLDGEFIGWLEGNAVVTPAGGMVNILRAHSYLGGIAAVIQVSADGKTSTFDPATGFIDFPGGAKKFTIRFDPASKRYWSLVNEVDEDMRYGRSAASVRNVLSLVSSPDLKHWTVRRRVLSHPDPINHGFQYVDWVFDGDDIIAASRTAYDDGISGAHNYHDANYLTFHRVKNFRR